MESRDQVRSRVAMRSGLPTRDLCPPKYLAESLHYHATSEVNDDLGQ